MAEYVYVVTMFEFKVNTDIVKEEDKVKIKVNLTKVNQEVNEH